MDKDSMMILPITTLIKEIHNLERIRDNHEKNNDIVNVDYLNARINKYKEAVEILRQYETTNSVFILQHKEKLTIHGCFISIDDAKKYANNSSSIAIIELELKKYNTAKNTDSI